MTLDDAGMEAAGRNTPAADNTQLSSGGQPTTEEYDLLLQAYHHFNRDLFDSTLRPCLITLQRRRQSFGFYAHQNFVNSKNEKSDEIALNPAGFAYRSVEENLAELVRHMCSHAIYHEGKGGRAGYHNRAWADRMKQVGLIPTADGEPGSAETGDKVLHYIAEHGSFIESCRRLLDQGFTIAWIDRFPDHETLSPQAQSAAAAATDPDVRAEDQTEMAFSEPLELETGDAPVLSEKNLAAAAATLPEHSEDDDDDSPPPPEAFLPSAPLITTFREQGTIFEPKERQSNRSRKTTYECKKCKNKVWGKPDMHLLCIDCETKYTVKVNKKNKQKKGVNTGSSEVGHA